MDDGDSGEWGDRDTGPFCRHWSDPSDCEEMCRCGHECRQHSTYADFCKVEGCDCDEFKDAED